MQGGGASFNWTSEHAARRPRCRKDNEECDDEDESEVEVEDEIAILRLMRAAGE